MKRTYYGIRKVNWDSMWHGLFKTQCGRESWDRITQAEAMVILTTLGPHIPKSNETISLSPLTVK